MCGCQISLASSRWVWIIFMGCHKRLFVTGCAFIYGESGYFIFIWNMDVVGDSLKISRWTILDPPLGNSMV